MTVQATDLRAFVHRRWQAESAESALRAQRLRAAVPSLAETLSRDFGATRVWLFGSLAWGEPDATADIDLAVEGLPAASYFAALTALMASAPAAVDLVRMETAAPTLRMRVTQEGQLVHHEP